MDQRPSDAQLVERTLEGDRAAFAALADRHLRGAFGLAYALSGSRGEGEEMAQEALVRAYVERPLHAVEWLPSGARHDLGLLRLSPGGRVRGILLRKGGTPAAGWFVTLEWRILQPPAITGEDGAFLLEHVPPGKHELRVAEHLTGLTGPWEWLEDESGRHVEVFEAGEVFVELRVER
jgi:hypothetical protein